VPVKAAIKGRVRTYSAWIAYLGSLRVQHSARMAAGAVLGGMVVQARRTTGPKRAGAPIFTFANAVIAAAHVYRLSAPSPHKPTATRASPHRKAGVRLKQTNDPATGRALPLHHRSTPPPKLLQNRAQWENRASAHMSWTRRAPR
jgi:hypothetical protein